ncbi:NAD-dependent epimerase/dehydratase family protein [Hyphomicrobium sp. DMF-1]|jgi:nucleoside-diphosphate-sugar epimerase|uniref:NAD-dependent epimerase/dehydratase family protein n=1 Tax=Hyphomicrobium sp. DMF-1 TaxID=3019544 RepID=UPI0022EBF4BB|nr:SDR family oxidoreductase [Hyphomicrobium sp. DMF-1]WBT38312.1 SDR family oxidoreductase [Hyphomicrobium sp. DMF-1]
MTDAARPRATVFGANGFVGRALVDHLTRAGYDVRALVRGDTSWRGAELGHAFYTIGLTADFRSRPFETIDAHVSLLTEILRGCRFQSFVYTSSTRVYGPAASTDELAPIPASPANPDHLYNLSKLMGEAACLGSGLATARVARLSNVFGADLASQNFLTSVLREAAETGRVQLKTSLASEKDYVWVGDVVRALEAIAVRGSEPITNVAFGRNITHREIMERIEAETGAAISVAPNAPTVTFPEIETRRLDALGITGRRPLVSMIGELAAAFKG